MRVRTYNYSIQMWTFSGVASATGGQDGINFNLSSTADARISGCILKGPLIPSTGIGKNGTGLIRIWNNILYDWRHSGGANGIGIWGNNAYLYNNTLSNCHWAINAGYSAGIVLKNNLSYANYDNYSTAGPAFSGTNNLSGPSGQMDAQMPATGGRNGVNVTFIDAGAKDFHLSSADMGAMNYGADLSNDGNLSFSTDIDGQTRSGTWDIGADEQQ